MKACVRCKKVKDLDEFALAPRMACGRHSWCRACMSAYSAEKNASMTQGQREAMNARRRANHKPRVDVDWRAPKLKSLYGMTVEQYDAMLEAQGGGCAVCGGGTQDGRRLHVDHDHGCCPGRRSCGRCIRGILCRACNLMLGNANDDPALLLKGILYLDQTRQRLKDSLVN